MTRPQADTTAPLLLLAAFSLLPFLLEDWQRAELTRYFAYMLFAASTAWVWGHCGLLSFGQAVFFGMGAYAMGLASSDAHAGLQGMAALVTGMAGGTLAAVLLAFCIGRVFLSGRQAAGPHFAIATLAISLVAEHTLTSSPLLGGANGLLGISLLEFDWAIRLGLPPDWVAYFLGLAVLACGAGLLIHAARHPWGIALQAIRNHPLRAEALGLDLGRERRRAYMLGAATAAAAGAFFVTQFGFAAPSLAGPAFSAEVIIWVALGGRKHIVTACLGALIVRGTETWLTGPAEVYRPLLLGLAFILVVLRYPEGLLAAAGRRLARRAAGQGPR